MSFQTDYDAYLASLRGGDKYNSAGVLWLSVMDNYAAQGLLVTDQSRGSIYIPAAGSGVKVAASDLPPVIYPGLYQPFNPLTGQAYAGAASGLYADYVPQPGQPIPFGVADATPQNPYVPPTGNTSTTTSPVVPTPQPTTAPPTTQPDLVTLGIYVALGYFGLKALGLLK